MGDITREAEIDYAALKAKKTLTLQEYCDLYSIDLDRERARPDSYFPKHTTLQYDFANPYLDKGKVRGIAIHYSKRNQPWVGTLDTVTGEFTPEYTYQDRLTFVNEREQALDSMRRKQLIPPYMRPGLQRYVEHHIRPGDFLYAVLCNDLLAAWKAADEFNRSMLELYPIPFYNNLPGTAWGSPNAVRAWLANLDQDDPEELEQGTLIRMGR